MDIEGLERTVLADMLGSLPRRPVVFPAIHGEAAREGAVRALAARGYGLTPLDGRPLDASDEVLAIPI